MLNSQIQIPLVPWYSCLQLLRLILHFFLLLVRLGSEKVFPVRSELQSASPGETSGRGSVWLGGYRLYTKLNGESSDLVHVTWMRESTFALSLFPCFFIDSDRPLRAENYEAPQETLCNMGLRITSWNGEYP